MRFIAIFKDIDRILFLRIAANVRGLPQFGYLMLCPPGDDAIKERKFDENEKSIAKTVAPIADDW
ncbi:MAG TPA: hypothetical protein VK489_07825 [Ferruginibacter sp.]|nr:hypothetical protein [Ferruginibacter sp.]